jgi:hypothetical protein
MLLHCSIQIADDLVDSELRTLPEPEKTGPTVQSILLTAALHELLLSQVSRESIAHLCADLLVVGMAHLHEGRIKAWDHTVAARVAEGLNGAQYRAFFRVLFDGTSHHAIAANSGWLFGCVLHVAGDRVSRDQRWLALSRADQVHLLTWGQARLEELRALALPGLDTQVEWFAGVLGAPLS